MATEAQYERAQAASERYRAPLLAIAYDPASDLVFFETAWGPRSASRKDIDLLRDVSPQMVARAYISAMGIHIDEIDLDINSAGLLATIFPDLRGELSDSF